MVGIVRVRVMISLFAVVRCNNTFESMSVYSLRSVVQATCCSYMAVVMLSSDAVGSILPVRSRTFA